MQLSHGSTQQQAAVEEIRQQLHVSQDQLNAIVHGFEKEMEAGLADAEGRTGDLKMIPSYVTGKTLFLSLFSCHSPRQPP